MINVFSIALIFQYFQSLLFNLIYCQNQSENCLKHMTSCILFKCKSMILSIAMPSYPNVTLFFSTLLMNTKLLLAR